MTLRARHPLAMLVAFTLIMAFGITNAHAANYPGNHSSFGFRTYGPNDTFENLIIEEGSRVIMVGSRVDGNIFVRDGAVLRAHNITVGGNIQSEGGARIRVAWSRIGGSFQADNTGPIDVVHTQVNGDIYLSSNRTLLGEIRIIKNRVGGNIQADSNRTRRFVVSYNIIDGNLQGESNNKRPIGTGNIVQGETDGQFEGF